MSSPPPTPAPVELVVEPHEADQRLDAFLAARLPQYSRVHLRRVINAAAVLVDGRRTKAAHRLQAGQRVCLTLPDLPREGPVPEKIPLDILYEDDALAAINKPAGMVVHPAKGHWQGTLTAALAWHFDRLSTTGGPTRPGIVHRLDRETSGVIVVAKTDAAHLALAAQFESRQTEKEYFAILAAVPDHDSDRIVQPIGVHPYHREKMAIRRDHTTSRDAETVYHVEERLGRYAVVRVLPKTGRTHQIRVHLAHIGCPILCDRLYSGRSQITRGEIFQAAGKPEPQPMGGPADEVLLDRVALHARRLKITHPITGQPLEFSAPLPEDLQHTLAMLRLAIA